jgi:hypothetical protein
MATVEEGLQAQIRNIEATYGKPMREWLAIVAASGLTKHTDVVRMLKTDYGLAYGAAHRVSLAARDAAAAPGGPDQAADPVSALYTGKKASLRPLHDALMNAILAFGDDIELAPKKGYLSLRRRKQFAMIQPNATGRIDLGLILGDVPVQGGLSPPPASTPYSATGSACPTRPKSTRSSPPGSARRTTARPEVNPSPLPPPGWSHLSHPPDSSRDLRVDTGLVGHRPR